MKTMETKTRRRNGRSPEQVQKTALNEIEALEAMDRGTGLMKDNQLIMRSINRNEVIEQQAVILMEYLPGKPLDIGMLMKRLKNHGLLARSMRLLKLWVRKNWRRVKTGNQLRQLIHLSGNCLNSLAMK